MPIKRENLQNYNYIVMKNFVSSMSCTITNESEEQHCKRIDVQKGKDRSIIKVFTTGTIQIQGPSNTLSKMLKDKKTSVEVYNQKILN